MSLEDERRVQYILSSKQSAEDASRDRRKIWKELWLLFQNKQDYSSKSEWQSQIFIPKISMVIEQASTVVKQAVMATRKLFKMESKEDVSELQKKYKEKLDTSNFAQALGEAMKTSFLLGFGMVKCLWDEGLSFSNIDVANLFIDPDFSPNSDKKPGYIIEYKEMELASLIDMAKRINKAAGKSIYNIREINKIEEDYSNSDVDTERRERLGLKEYSKVNKMVQILEFWGDIVSEDGKKVKKNQLIFLANEKYIIRQQENPFWHEKPPYVPIVPVTYPFRGICGVSLVEPVVRLQYSYNNIMNLAIDNLNFSVNKVFEYNTGNVMNARNLTKLYPGKLIAKTGQGRALEEVRTSNVGQDVFQMLDLIKNEIEKGTAVTEFLMGTSGKSKTATEAELKTAQAQGLFNTIARDIEKNSIKPLIEMGYSLCVQFDEAPDIEIEFKVGGLSLLLVQREQVQRITEILGIALQSETLGRITNIKELWQKLLNFYNLDDVYEENQPLRPDQKIQASQAGADRAREEVSKMSDEQIMQKVQQMGI